MQNSNTNTSVSHAFAALSEAGLCMLPALPAEKRPALPSWKPYQTRMPSPEEIAEWQRSATGICVVTGAISDNLVVLDFDEGGVLFEPWRQKVDLECPGLLDTVYIESTPSGGKHVIFRTQLPPQRSRPYARRCIEAASSEPIIIGGKSYTPAPAANGGWQVVLTQIETRAEGSLCLCAPTPGYVRLSGSLTDVPRLTEQQVAVLLAVAIELNSYSPPVCVPAPTTKPSKHSGQDRPGDRFNESGDVVAVLRKAGWTLFRDGVNQQWTRPGKELGTSATLRDRVFYVFSSNAAPFAPDRGYAPFSVYALLEHGGNYGAAAKQLRREQPSTRIQVNEVSIDADPVPAYATDHPGVLSPELLEVPGILGDLIKYTLSTAPHPEPTLAFAGALAAVSALTARKVTDEHQTRPGLYIVSLADSGVGKDAPRKVNQRVLEAADMLESLADSVASGEGLEDQLLHNPVLLLQPDEIDHMISAISSASRTGDYRYPGIMSMLLKLWGQSSGVHMCRVRAGERRHSSIYEPSVTLLGTAVPSMYFAAMTPTMLCNGFFARMLLFEAGVRSPAQDTRHRELPKNVIRDAEKWADLCRRMRTDERPDLITAREGKGTDVAWRSIQQRGDELYHKARLRDDEAGKALWARYSEKARKLSLLYACSVSGTKPTITTEGLRWASQVVEHSTNLMLYHAERHVTSSPFAAKCAKVMTRVQNWFNTKGEPIPGFEIARGFDSRPSDLDDVIQMLSDQGRIHVETVPTPGRSALKVWPFLQYQQHKQRQMMN